MSSNELLTVIRDLMRNEYFNGAGTAVTLTSGAVAVASSSVKTAVEWINKERLEKLTPDIDYASLPLDWVESYEVAESACLEWKKRVNNTEIFTQKQRRQILKEAIKNRPDAVSIDILEKDFAPFFDALEESLDKLCSLGEKQIMAQSNQQHAETMAEIQELKVGQKVVDSKIDKVQKMLNTIHAEQTNALSAASQEKEKLPEPREVHTANKLYADSFKKVLPFHQYGGIPNWELVTLENLFVMPKYHMTYGSDCPSKDLEKRLVRFFGERDEGQILLIEGDAGTGKSTLTGWLNRKALAEPGFLNRRILLTVRLRDLASDGNKGIDLAKLDRHIVSYLNLSSVHELITKYSNGILWMDGFDELCMMEGNQGSHNTISSFLKQLRKNRSFKVVITSRPGYLVPDVDKALMLEHFDEGKRIDWMAAYKEKCKQEIKPFVEIFIRNMKKDNTSNICDTPFTLYLLAANELKEDDMGNAWAIYHSIFTEKTKEADYNVVLSKEDDEKTAHPASEDWETHYRVCQEIAYWMYKEKNEQLHVTQKDLEAIVTEMDKDGLSEQALKSITEHCYPLCSYWKENAAKGAVEFYHNNIRDFFLCEKICYELDRMYNAENWNNETAIKALCRLFQHGKIERRVEEFIQARAKYYQNHQNESTFGYMKPFEKVEHTDERLPGFFEAMLTDGSVFCNSGVLENSKDPISMIETVFYDIVAIYWYSRVIWLENREKQKLKWWNDVRRVNENRTLPTVFNNVFSNSFGSFSNLQGVELRRIDLQGANLQKANLQKANLQRADLSKVHMNCADLKGANLQRADLQRADLRQVDLRGKTNLKGVDFRGADLRGAKLNGVDLQGANLRRAKLGGANMHKAYLWGTTLPDGFFSYDQQEQIDHLKSLNIEGLII